MILEIEKKDKGLFIKEEIFQTFFRLWEIDEKTLEDFIINNRQTILGERKMFYIGKQKSSCENLRCDLLFVDTNGNLIIIEIKRDIFDTKNLFEQSFSYAQSFAQLKTIDEFCDAIFRNTKDFFSFRHLRNDKKNNKETLVKELSEFLLKNHTPLSHFNLEQQIILISSGYNNHLLQGISWLISHGINISLIQLQPFELVGNKFIAINRTFPLGKTKNGTHILDKFDSITFINTPWENKMIEYNL
ncbi:Uncharacterised protein [Metamycoplasma arthritidis]|uniref:DUF91 domain-containing protein n=1 Tax=Metamycoplasma arthritidis (strain 158L3-1) TaxID=243272 RepID=B3PMB8_META1|nr:hypothetical protein [Metamycoplasma arthritidis]ACF07170.1 conserved hypothetical protein [Metamycoplasma arthritidis 158L3-1]VEU78694.1 Uncharacterised protein [Metamycoplasma arthritidis]